MTVPGLDASLRLARLCKALGHPARVAIVRHLRQRGAACTCGEITAQLPLAQSTVSQHLRALKMAGLLLDQPEPPRVLYRLDERVLDEFRRAAAAL